MATKPPSNRHTHLLLAIVIVGLSPLLGVLLPRPGPALAQTGTPAASSVVTPADDAVARVDFTVDLGDFDTKAQLTYPAGASGPFPTVVLIPGSGPADMDFTLSNPATGEPTSAIFRDIADYLSTHGYAVVRYNKHYVEGPDAYYSAAGAEYWQKFTFPMLLNDARLVYEAALAMPEVDPSRIVLYGWSEGSIIAIQLALAEPSIAGIILQGALASSFADVFRYQDRELAVRFMREYADADHDGKFSLDDLIAAIQIKPGTTGGFAFIFTFDPTVTSGTPQPNPAIDRNGDGLLDIEAEVIPFLDDFFANFDANSAAGRSPYGPQYGSAQQFRPNVEVIGELRQPVLLLAGENDANVPAGASRELDAALAAANHPDHTLRIYPGLGHSLGPAATVFDDAFAPIAPAPLADVAVWLDARFGDAAGATPVP